MERKGVDAPAFQFSVLTCKGNLLATKTILANGEEIPYGRTKFYRFKYCGIETLEDFAKALDWLSDQPCKFVIRGQLLPGLSGWQQRRLVNEPVTVECPPRRWIPLDFDGVKVPTGLGAPDKLASAGQYIRDNILPDIFKGVRCVAAATASTGRVGADRARLRLLFALAEAQDNEALWGWADALSRRAPDLGLDPSVFQAMQPIYTARPVCKGVKDPVPPWGRVAVLGGGEDTVALDLPKVGKRRVRAPSAPIVVCNDIPAEIMDMTAADAGRGVVVIDTSDKAWAAIRRAFADLDGCATGRRHMMLNRAAWQLARLVSEGEVTEAVARDAFLTAAGGIDNSDGRYDPALIQRHIDDAFTDVGR
jgi:hypothetical protein